MSEKTNYTTGPWRIEEHGGTAYILPQIGNDGACITSVFIKGNGQNRSKNLANALLIVAAPELLAALEDCVESLSRLPDREGAWRVTSLHQARAAIAKARGENGGAH